LKLFPVDIHRVFFARNGAKADHALHPSPCFHLLSVAWLCRVNEYELHNQNLSKTNHPAKPGDWFTFDRTKGSCELLVH
jgi:hypothetical protein